MEDYLEAILILQQKGENIRSVDLARYMEYSKASICHAVKKMRDGGLLTVDEYGCLCLTDTGKVIAETVYERHQFFVALLIAAGVDQETAEQDACQIKHAISNISFQQLRGKAQQAN